MSSTKEILSCSVPPALAWCRLVARSIAAWEILTRFAPAEEISKQIPKEIMQECGSLDDFFSQASNPLIFWFFQRWDAFVAQSTMNKWSRDLLEDYILVPASLGFVNRNDCFFVSHFWRTSSHPDPDGKYLRLYQDELRTQSWTYIWVDWTCIPQDLRTPAAERYFLRSLETMSGIIRNCGVTWFYPPFEARMWILYEVAEYTLTCSQSFEATPDMNKFKNHVQEMLQTGVLSVLDRYGYTCSYERDRAFLTSWLEILVLLTRLRIDIDDIRRVMDNMTWGDSSRNNDRGHYKGCSAA